jgi:arginine exporter protein ArgO
MEAFVILIGPFLGKEHFNYYEESPVSAKLILVFLIDMLLPICIGIYDLSMNYCCYESCWKLAFMILGRLFFLFYGVLAVALIMESLLKNSSYSPI